MEDYEIEESYKEMLDECYGVVKIGDSEFWASDILRELDPIAYSIGLTDYTDSLEED